MNHWTYNKGNGNLDSKKGVQENPIAADSRKKNRYKKHG